MTITATHIMRKVVPYFSIPVFNTKLVVWQDVYNHERKEGLSVEDKVQLLREIENCKRKQTCVGILSCKFYDPNDLEKRNQNY